MTTAADAHRGRISLARFEATGPGENRVETHVSSLLFDGDVVHKRKKAVPFPFVDLSTLDQRRDACEHEVALNRRFSPDVYLGVEDVVDEHGVVVDHAVVMRRMPDERRLSTLVRSGADVNGCVRAVARRMAACHSSAATGEQISSVATPAALQDLWRRSLVELEPFVPAVLDRSTVDDIREHADRYLQGRSPLLAERIAQARVVDGHGDLLADDIFCLPDGPRILDGLEFDDRLRWGDVLNDVGFLAMDLERLGRLDLAHDFLDAYAEFSGETHPPSLADHYIAYRALVRAKIACLAPGGGAAMARRYLDVCHHHLYRGRIQLVVVGGLPGTGKSALAKAIGDTFGWPVLRSDETRKELFGVDPLVPMPAPYQQDLYSPDVTEATYEALHAHARRLLEGGHSAVLDASFASGRWRARARDLAVRTRADLAELRCVLPAHVAATRLLDRSASGRDASDAGPTVAARMDADFEPWPSALSVDTRPPLHDVLPGVVDRLAGPRRPPACSATQ